MCIYFLKFKLNYCVFLINRTKMSSAAFLITNIFIIVFLSIYGIHEVLSQELEGSPASLPNQGICGSKVIMNRPQNLEELRNCSIIDGVLRIVLFDWVFQDSDYANYSFPELREVTEYVIIYRIYGLKSLGSLFPNLTLIRGRTLFMNYALVIFECKNLNEIGLRSLTKITRGSVRIQNNPQMCFDTTIDWLKITGTNDGHIFRGNGGASCPGSQVCRGCPEPYCWSSRYCQRIPSPRCHPECLETCNPINGTCHRCRHLINDNTCVKECPEDRYEHRPTSHCLTKSFCERMYYGRGWVWDGQCIDACPKGFVKNITNGETICVPCSTTPCRQDCIAGEISSISDAQSFKECTHINGSLQIRMIGDYGPSVMKELEACLGNIEVINGYLKVYRSLPLTSLNFFKNLTEIKGENLEYHKYSLLVYENGNLQTLWDWNLKKKFLLRNGNVYFQFNPKLCLKEIDKLRNITKINATIFDVSPDSNGVKINCDYFPLKTKSYVIDTKNVTISWERFFPNKDDKPFTGYQLFYLEDPEDDVTSYFGRDACLTRVWKSIIIPENPNLTTSWMSQNITDLHHSLRYAYYVETFDGSVERHISDSSAKSARTPISFFIMKSEVPPPPDFRAVSYSPDSISIYWSNNTEYRGNITRYIIELHIQHDEKELLDRRNYCIHPLKLYQSALNQKTMQTQEDLAPQDSCRCKEMQMAWKELVDKSMKWQIHDMMGGRLDDLFPEDTYDLVDNNNHTKRRRHAEKFVIPKDFHQIMNRSIERNITEKEKYHYFSTDFLSHHQNFTIPNLRHFTKYLIFMAACIGPLDSDCGALALTVERTLKSKTVDKITNLCSYDVNSSAVGFRWTEPEDVNGVILSYTIEYKNDDIEDFLLTHVCVTRRQHELNDQRFILTDVPPGAYHVRVKATSLAGDGEYTEYNIVIISEERNSQLHWFTIFLMVIAAFTGLSYIALNIQKEMRCQPSDEEELLPAEEMVARYSRDSDGDEEIQFYEVNSRRRRGVLSSLTQS